MSAMRKPDSAASPDQPILVDVRTLSKLLGRSTQSISRDDKQGKIPRPIRLSSSVRWDLDEIREWVAAKCPSREVWEKRSGKSEAQPSTHAVDCEANDSNGGA
jgi:predicted DNA-binding transcriptional regulator AlpA